MESIWVAAICAGVAFAAAYNLSWLARSVAPKLGWVDWPDGGRKRHRHSVPLMGGLAIYLSVMLGLAALLGLGTRDSLDPLRNAPSICLLVSAGFVCAVGLIDDRWPLRARSKFALQLLAIVPYVGWGRTLERIDFLGHVWELGPLAIPLTMLWLVAGANGLNLLDGLDGLATTIGLIALAALATLATISGNLTVAWFALALVGGMVGFLIHNWPPAKLYLGDAGSLTIGFLVAALSVEACLNQVACCRLIIPVAILGVLFFDTIVAMMRRRLSGRSIGMADRGHIHHRLLQQGMSPRQTLLTISASCALMATLGVVSLILQSDLPALAACVAVPAAIVASSGFGYDETMLALRRALDLRRRRLPGQASHSSTLSVILPSKTPRPAAEEANRHEEVERRAA